jgi:hypothetical protein
MTITLELKCGSKGFRAHPVQDHWILSGNSRILHLGSEDILTANVFGILKNLDPKVWITSFFDHACKFSRTDFPNLYAPDNFDEFRVSLWQDLDSPPRWLEGKTQADVLVKLRNCAIILECKGLAPLQTFVTTDERNGDPKLWWDQAIRNIVRGYAYVRCHLGDRDFVFVVLSMSEKEETFRQYESWTRIKEQVESRITKDFDLDGIFPMKSRDDVCKKLSRQIKWVKWSDLKEALDKCSFETSEGFGSQNRFRDDLVAYLDLKTQLWTRLLGSRSQKRDENRQKL